MWLGNEVSLLIIEINLLPWREEKREKRRKLFYFSLAVSLLVGAGCSYCLSLFYEHESEVQANRNEYVGKMSSQLDSAIREVGEIEEVRDEILSQLEVFSSLQEGRFQTVSVMSELTSTLVDGVYYTSMSRRGDNVELMGRAENNRQVSDQLRSLSSSEYFGEPLLSEVEGAENGDERLFNLEVSQRYPNGFAKKENIDTF